MAAERLKPQPKPLVIGSTEIIPGRKPYQEILLLDGKGKLLTTDYLKGKMDSVKVWNNDKNSVFFKTENNEGVLVCTPKHHSKQKITRTDSNGPFNVYPVGEYADIWFSRVLPEIEGLKVVTRRRFREASNQQISIRKAVMEDSIELIDIQENDGFDHAYYLTPDKIHDAMRMGQRFFIAEKGGETVGFAAAIFEGLRSRLRFLSVYEEFQREGIGTTLLDAVLEEVRQEGSEYLSLYLDTGSGTHENNKMYDFLSRYGFKEAGIERNRFGQDRDAIILHYYLSD